jgi:hypothetical protein
VSFLFPRIESVPERSCSPARCQNETDDRVRDKIEAEQVYDEPADEGYAAPFREDVDRIRALCQDEGAVSTRARVEFETVCKNYTPRNCEPDDCRTREICYKKPRLTRWKTFFVADGEAH